MIDVSRCDARIKVLLAAVGLIVAVGARHAAGPLVLAAAALGGCVANGQPPKKLLRVLRRLALSTAIPLLLVAWWHGRAASALWIGRVGGASCISLWLASTTPFVALQAAGAWLRIPAPILELLGLTQRYAQVFASTHRTAREAQTLRLGYADTARGIRSMGVLGGLVLRRALTQIDTVADAMQMRGYRGHLWLPQPGKLTRHDAVAAGFGCCIVAVAGALAW